jgi:tetratricopeptide (TPR) repeat protein
MIALWFMTHSSELRRRLIERVITAVVVIYAATAVWMGSAWKNQETFYQMAFSSTPNNADLYVSKADYYVETGKVDEAIEVYNIAASKAGTDQTRIRVHMSLGEIYAKLKRYDKALAEFQSVLTIEPDNDGATIGLGNVYWLSGDLVTARSYYERVLLIDPDHSIARKNLDAVREILSAQ